MRALDLILFDCDGVLLDSEVISSQCAAAELAEVGMHLSPAEVLAQFLGTARSKIAQHARDHGHIVSDDFVARIETRMHQAFETELRAIAGVRELLLHLALPVCVASSSSLPYIRHGLTLTGLLDLFEGHLFSASMVSRPKPAPDLFLYAAQQMGVSPDRCLVIEDSLAGVAAARAAHMRVFGFLGGSHLDADALTSTYRAAGCDAVAASMQQLGEHIAELEPTALHTTPPQPRSQHGQ